MRLQNLPCKKLCVYLVTGSFVLSTLHCSGATQVTDWRDVPPYRPIKVVLKSGESHLFQRWHMTSDSALVGLTWHASDIQDAEYSSRWQIHRIPCDSVASIYTIDHRPATTAELAMVIGGVTACAFVLWYVVHALSFMPSGKWN